MTQYVSKSLFKRLVDNIQRKIDKIYNDNKSRNEESPIFNVTLKNSVDNTYSLDKSDQEILDACKSNKLVVINGHTSLYISYTVKNDYKTVLSLTICVIDGIYLNYSTGKFTQLSGYVIVFDHNGG